jgi:hypothetical protein
MEFDKGGNILDPRADQAQHVPAYDFQLLNPRPSRSQALFESLPNRARAPGNSPDNDRSDRMEEGSFRYLVSGMADSRAKVAYVPSRKCCERFQEPPRSQHQDGC